MQTIKSIIKDKEDIIISCATVIAAIAYISLEQFNVFSLIICILNIVFVYLFYFNKNYELISYGLIFTVVSISISLFSNTINIWLQLIVGLSISLIYYFVYLNQIKHTDIKLIYSIIIFLACVELTYIVDLLNTSNTVKSLFIVIFFYLVSGLIKLYNENKFSLYNILRYSIVFLLGFVLISLNINYVI